MNIRKLQISLFHLHSIVDELSSIVNGLIETPTSNPNIYIPIFKYCIIRSCAFWDEIKQFLSKALHTEEKHKALTCVKKRLTTKRDEYFPDLYNIRNNAFAHNFRGKTDKSIFESDIQYTFPKSAEEHLINIKLMDIMLAFIKALYPEIHSTMNEGISIPKENAKPTSITTINYKGIIEDLEKHAQKCYDEYYNRKNHIV